MTNTSDSDNNDNDRVDNPETLMKFPCDFPIKIVSNIHFDLETFATNVVHTHAPKMEYIPATTNQSSKGNYQAVTIIIKATSQQQIDAIYKDLTANKNVIMVL